MLLSLLMSLFSSSCPYVWSGNVYSVYFCVRCASSLCLAVSTCAAVPFACFFFACWLACVRACLLALSADHAAPCWCVFVHRFVGTAFSSKFSSIRCSLFSLAVAARCCKCCLLAWKHLSHGTVFFLVPQPFFF